ncbi:tetratricopeptide repeat protein [Sphingomonas sp. JC676]|nr:tetratricopeptide repeat protein [Sphingomonas sp. JC676]
MGGRVGERAGAGLITALALLAALPAVAQQDPADYVRARAADAQGAAAIAAAGYAKALAASPDDEVIALRAYRQALSAGDYSLASKAAAVMVRKGVAPPDTAVLAFSIALHNGDRLGAQTAIQRMAGGPLDFLAPVLGAWLAFDRGEDGVASLDKAGGSGLSRRYTSRHRALLLLAARRTDEAMVSLLPLMINPDDDEDLRIDAARLLAATGERDRARRLLDGDRPEIVVLRKRMGKSGKADAAFGASRLFLGLAQDIAKEDMQPLTVLLTRSALLLDPEDDRARLYLAEALSEGGSSDLALAVLKEVNRKGPFARGAAAGRVAALRRAGRGAEALAAARAMAHDRHATGADAQTYGDLLADDAQYDAAAAAYAAGLDRQQVGEEWLLHYLRGTALDRAGRWDEALPALRRAVQLAPMEPQALEYLGYAQVERGENLTDAEALLVRAQALRPNDPGIADSLGWAYYQQGDVARALPLLEKAARVDPGGARANEHLGDAYWRLGRHYEARYAWRAAAVYADPAAAGRIAGKLARGLTLAAN